MVLKEGYLAAVRDVARLRLDTATTPSVLVEACVAVLPVDGAGISMNQRELRVPLAWSSEDAATAERTQTTLGQGPCLAAAAAQIALVADAGTVTERWPVYAVELGRRTPYLSVASLPLGLPGEPVFGALDLYATRPDLSAVLVMEEVVAAVGAPMAVLLTSMLNRLYDDEVEPPAWMDDEPATNRVAVWTAVGMLIADSELDETKLDDRAALSRLRGYAFSNDLMLDEVAARLVNRRLTTKAVLR